MRAVIISSVILILIILLIIFCMVYVNYASNLVSKNIEMVKNSVEDDKWEQAEEDLKGVLAIFKKHQNKLAMIFEHEELDKIQMSLSRVKEYVTCEDRTNSLAELSELDMLITHLPDRDKITLVNLL